MAFIFKKLLINEKDYRRDHYLNLFLALNMYFIIN